LKRQLSLVGLTLAVTLSTSVLALERKDVVNRLSQIPVFALINEKGSPILVSPKNDPSKAQYATFFLQPQEAENFQNLLKRSDPKLAKTVQLRALPLSLALQFAEDQKDKKPPVRVDIVPHKPSMDYALTLAKQMSKEVKTFPGVPVFALTDLKGSQVISVRRDGKGSPSQLYFFDEDDAKQFFATLKKSNPKLAQATRISAAPFQNLFDGMLKIQKPAEADQIVLVAPTASLQYAKKINPAPAK